VTERDGAADVHEAGAEQSLVTEEHAQLRPVQVADARLAGELQPARPPLREGQDRVLAGPDVLREATCALEPGAARDEVARRPVGDARAARPREPLREFEQVARGADRAARRPVLDRPGSDVPTGGQRLFQPVEPVGSGNGVGVGERDELPARARDADVAGAARQRPLRRADERNPGPASRQRILGLGAARLDDHELALGMSRDLRLQRGERPGKRRPRLVGRHDDARAHR
jgi:hypothetical protein